MTNILTPTYPERRGENEADRYEAEATQTILGPVPLSVAIATTLKQLREECADLFDGGELPDTKAPKITLPGASGKAPMGLPQELARREERVLNIARALAEGCTLDSCGPTCCALGCALDEGEERNSRAAGSRAAGSRAAGAGAETAEPTGCYGSPCEDESLELSGASGVAESETRETERYAAAGDAEEGLRRSVSRGCWWSSSNRTRCVQCSWTSCVTPSRLRATRAYYRAIRYWARPNYGR